MGWQDILKSYDLDEFIIRKDKKDSKKKKGEKDFTVDVPGGKLTVTQTARISQLQETMKTWYQTCNNLKLDDIGIVAEKGKTSLLDLILNHVDSGVQRPKQEEKVGAMDAIKDVMDIINDQDIYTKDDWQNVKNFIEVLEDIQNDSRANPKNILFTEQHSRTKKVTVRGHYRTKWYEDKTGKKKVDSDWYDKTTSSDPNDNSSTAEPPMWQALFNGLTLKKATIPGLEKGLLSILIDFHEEMPNQPISDIPVVGKQGREAVIKIKNVIQGLSNILANQASYHSVDEPFKRLWVNVEGVRKQLNAFEFAVAINDKAGVASLKRLVPVLEDAVSEKLEGFKIVQITPGLLRSLIRTMGINLDTFKHGSYQGMFLHRPWTTKVENTRKKLFEKEYKRAKKDGNLPRWAERDDEEGGVKKSWEDLLKLMPPSIKPMQNPAAGLHMPSVYSKERQTEISRNKGETCDYCDKDVILDCRDCNQKLCRQHLDKPCAIKKQLSKTEISFLKAERKTKEPVQMSGGNISIVELRRLIQEIDDDSDPEEDASKDLVMVIIPTHYEDGLVQIKAGIYDYNVAKQMFGASQLKALIANAEGIMGARLINIEDLIDTDLPITKNKPMVVVEEVWR